MSATSDLWARLGGDGPAEVTHRGASTGLSSPLPVGDLATGAVAAAGLAAARLSGRAAHEVVVDAPRVGASFRADRLMRVDGRAPEAFAALSGFWPTVDGWVRTHANYAHHRSRLLAALGIGGDAGPDRLGAVLRERRSVEVEDAVTAAGGVAVAVRGRDAWTAHPQGVAVAAEPLVDVHHTDVPGAPSPRPPEVRVLDLTRVIAGPVATRTLALLGADVLRLDPPGLPELPAQHADTGLGKRTALLDGRTDRARLDALVDRADVVVLGYRPGALDTLGLDPDTLLARRRDLVVVRLDAWGWTGPFAGRRGFDSVVQAACGIAGVHRGDDGRPGALPAQALDHATGYLAAAAALRGLADRGERGGSVWGLALARTAEWLFRGPCAGRPAPTAQPAPEPSLQRLGGVEVPLPALILPGVPDRWPVAARPLGTDEPAWSRARDDADGTW